MWDVLVSIMNNLSMAIMHLALDNKNKNTIIKTHIMRNVTADNYLNLLFDNIVWF